MVGGTTPWVMANILNALANFLFREEHQPDYNPRMYIEEQFTELKVILKQGAKAPGTVLRKSDFGSPDFAHRRRFGSEKIPCRLLPFQCTKNTERSRLVASQAHGQADEVFATSCRRAAKTCLVRHQKKADKNGLTLSIRDESVFRLALDKYLMAIS